MVELPELIIPPDLGHILERLRQVGILPVITHPERNRALWRDERLFSGWIEAGCYSQITAQSLEGHFGRTAKETAWRLVEEDQAHFVASDGHDLEHRPPRLDRAYAAVVRKYDEETAQRLFVSNPRNVLDGAFVENISRPRKQKNRFWIFG
jgi:protein-tyrosine phosphatase